MSQGQEVQIPLANDCVLVPYNSIQPHLRLFLYFCMNFIEICVFLHAATLSFSKGFWPFLAKFAKVPKSGNLGFFGHFDKKQLQIIKNESKKPLRWLKGLVLVCFCTTRLLGKVSWRLSNIGRQAILIKSQIRGFACFSWHIECE